MSFGFLFAPRSVFLASNDGGGNKGLAAGNGDASGRYSSGGVAIGDTKVTVDQISRSFV